jgi:hypothetical protein
MPLGSTTVCLAHRMSTRGLFSTREVSLPTSQPRPGAALHPCCYHSLRPFLTGTTRRACEIAPVF